MLSYASAAAQGREIRTRLTLNDTQINNIKDVINRNVNLTLEQITDTLLPRPFKDDYLKLDQEQAVRKHLHNFVPDEINGSLYWLVCYIKVNINTDILDASSINEIKNRIEMKLNTNIIPYLQTADKHKDIINEINNIINIPELVFTVDSFHQPNATAPGGGTLENYYLGYQAKKIPEYRHLDNEFLRKVACVYNHDIIYWTVLHNLPPIARYEIFNPYMLLFGGYRLVKYEFTESQKQQLRLDYNLNTSVEIPYIEYLMIFYENCYENRTENNISDFATYGEDIVQKMLSEMDYRIVMRTLKNNYDENKNIFYMPIGYSFGNSGALHISNDYVEDKNLRKFIIMDSFKIERKTNINIYANISNYINGTNIIDHLINNYFDNGGTNSLGSVFAELDINTDRYSTNISDNNISGYFKSGHGYGCFITRFVDQECPINASSAGFRWPFSTFIHEFTHQIQANISNLGNGENSSSFSFRESLNLDPPKRNIGHYCYILNDKINKMYDKHILEYSGECAIDNSHYSCNNAMEFFACFTTLWFYVLRVISVPGGSTMWQSLFDKIQREDNTDYSDYEHNHFGICSFNDMNIFDNLKIEYTPPRYIWIGGVRFQSENRNTQEILFRDLFHEIFGIEMNPCRFKFLNRAGCENFKIDLCNDGDIFSKSLARLRQLNPSSQQQQLQGASSRADTPLAALWTAGVSLFSSIR